MAITFNTSRHDAPPDSGGTTRPKEYDRDCIGAIFALVAEGMTLTDACTSNPAFPSRSTIYGWIQEREDIRKRYELAQEFQRAVYEDEVISLVDDVKTSDLIMPVAPGIRIENRASDRLAKAVAQTKNRMWLLSKLSQRFADKSSAAVAHSSSVDGMHRTITVTGGLPRVPLGSLPPEERAAAVAAAARTRTITRESIENPFNLDIAAIEAEDDSAERGLLNDPANYD
jgi:hypothetical protein